MIKLLQFMKSILPESIIILIVILCIRYFIGFGDVVIGADGCGYYDYLPSCFIHHDLIRKDLKSDIDSLKFERINNVGGGAYSNYGSHIVNKYPVGTALLQMPFFFIARVFATADNSYSDGFQKQYQKAIQIATFFYLFCGLLFLRKLLHLYDIKAYIIIFCQSMIALATSVMAYSSYDASFSHIYSFFSITAFLYLSRLYFKTNRNSSFILMCALLGLAIIIRNINILIVLFLPFIARDYMNFIYGIRSLMKSYNKTILGLFVFGVIIFIQILVWYLQTGDFFIYSYQGESFDFSNPHFLKILFSYRKGLYVYTPIIFLASLSVFFLLKNKRYFEFFSWVGFFSILTYILSSWWSWYYGCSYGQRVYIDYYAIFFIPFAIFLNEVKFSKFVMIISLPFIPISIIQTYQYKNYILHMIDMDKDKFWTVFLRTHDQYRGLVWKNNVDTNNYMLADDIYIPHIQLNEEKSDCVYIFKNEDIPDLSKITLIQVEAENDYNPSSELEIIIMINRISDGHVFTYIHKYFIHLNQNGLKNYHKGKCDFIVDPVISSDDLEIKVVLKNNGTQSQINNLKINFFAK